MNHVRVAETKGLDTHENMNMAKQGVEGTFFVQVVISVVKGHDLEASLFNGMARVFNPGTDWTRSTYTCPFQYQPECPYQSFSSEIP